MLIVDGHLDLAMNAIQFNRDLTATVPQIRESERPSREKGRACNTVAFPEMHQGEVMISFATLIARTAHATNSYVGYRTQQICHAVAMSHLAYYELLERQGFMRILKDWPAVQEHVREWKETQASTDAPKTATTDPAANAATVASATTPSTTMTSTVARPPLGAVISMEGADPITSPDEVPFWWDRGLRLLGLAHYGVSTYAHGTGTEGGLLGEAKALLKAMEETGMILDLTHLADQSFWEALEHFGGPVHASHCNCRALVNDQRQLSDDMIRAVVERGGVIGVVFDMWMLQPDWVHWVPFNEKTKSLEAIVDHIEHICNLTGNADHVAIGSDLDGGYGKEQTPLGFDTIADLQKLVPLLEKRGFSRDDIAKIMHGNWLGLLERAWS